MNREEKDFISLKEASRISGYTADYLGQLIRSGKLDGKQVFSSVSWVTTRKALEEYMREGGRVREEETPPTRILNWVLALGSIPVLLQLVLWLCIVALSLFVLFLGYVFAVSIDHQIEEDYLSSEYRS
jgi:hypothetical protein